MTLPATHNALGFKVTKDDGKTIFHRVPIFAECAREDLTFDAAWLAGAVSNAKQQERDGYLPPLHIRHHEPATEQTNSVVAVGVFRILDAAPMSFKGKRITALYADLIFTDDYMAEEAAKMKFPYRSVEIFNPEGPPAINSLALLDHEAPYLELPVLLAGDVEDRRTQTDGIGVAGANSFSLNYANDSSDPMLGSVRRGTRAALLFKFPDEDTMPETKTDEQAKEPKTNFADEGEDKDKENMEGEPGLDVGAVCEAIKSGEISIADMDALLAAIQSQKTEVVEEEDGDEAAPAPAPGAEIMKDKSEFSKNFARIQGENDALKARLDARDASDQRAKDVSGAMKRLEGKPLGANLEEKLTNFHKKAGGDAELFKEYVDSMAMNAGELPTDDSGANFSAHPKTPASAMAYQALGGEAVDKAAQFARQYKTLSGIRASEESYVRTNMKHAGYELPETATA